MSIYDDSFFMIYCCVLAGIFGAVLGSFLNCAAWRIAHGESFVKGRSRCTSCGHVLGFLDLVPVFSWLLLGGKCRYCKTKISPRYMLTELFFAAVSVLSLMRFDLSGEYVRNMILACCLFCLSLVDLEIFEIPNECVLLPAIAWAAAVPFMDMSKTDVLVHIISGAGYGIGMLILVLIFDKILGRETMGGGRSEAFCPYGSVPGCGGIFICPVFFLYSGAPYGSCAESVWERKKYAHSFWSGNRTGFLRNAVIW